MCCRSCDDCQYESRLSKFLGYRNRIAHGNNGKSGIEVKEEFADLIEELMERIISELDDCLKNGKYLERSIIEVLQLNVISANVGANSDVTE